MTDKPENETLVLTGLQADMARTVADWYRQQCEAHGVQPPEGDLKAVLACAWDLMNFVCAGHAAWLAEQQAERGQTH